MSREGFVTFLSTFGTFGVTEVFNQMRLNDINNTNLKLVCTHLDWMSGKTARLTSASTI